MRDDLEIPWVRFGSASDNRRQFFPQCWRPCPPTRWEDIIHNQTIVAQMFSPVKVETQYLRLFLLVGRLAQLGDLAQNRQQRQPKPQ